MNDGAAAHSTGIQAAGLVRRFENGRVRAVDGLDLSIAAGEFVAICGPSGCGKTTLLNLIAAFDKPDAGTLSVGGYSLTRLTESEADEFRQTAVGLVFQLHNLLPDLTALENVQVPMLAAAVPSRRRYERARDLLGRVGLEHRQHALPATLSGGERQRVAIARALANQPSVLLADEPTGALDSGNADRLLELLEGLQHEVRATVVVVTHDLHVAQRADRVLHMLDGRIAGAAHHVAHDPDQADFPAVRA